MTCFCQRHCFYLIVTLTVISYVYAGCSKTYKETSGTIKTPNFPNEYALNMHCIIKIKVQRGYRINLKWKSFRVNGAMQCNNGGDYVEVSIGCSERILTRFCNKDGDFIPNDIYSTDECMKINFYSDSKSQSSIFNGFSAEYTAQPINQAVPQPSHCNTKLVARSGIIKSPSWPLSYYKKIPTICTWKIEIPEDYIIKFLFMNMDTYAPNDGSKKCFVSGNDYLQFKGRKRSDNELLDYRFCNRQPRPFYRYYDYFKSIDISFKIRSNTNHSYKGFMVGYTIFKKTEIISQSDDSGTSFEWWYIVVLIIVLLFLGYICRKKSRENGGVKAMFQNRFQTEDAGNVEPGPIYPMPTSSQAAPYTPQAPAYAPPSYQQILINNEIGNAPNNAPPPPPPPPPPILLPISACSGHHGVPTSTCL